jgi:Domain of unknown function (DUF4340)
MKPRTTLVLLVTALLLGGFVYYYEVHVASAQREAEERAQRLFPDVDAESIDWITLSTRGKPGARLERRESGWVLTAPLEFPADRFASDGLAANLAGLVRESTLEQPQPLAEYGLDTEARVLRFSAGGVKHELRLGYEAPLGSNTYAAIGGSDAVFTVQTYKAKSFDKPLADLRDKRILDFDTASIAHVEVRWPGGGARLERVSEADTKADSKAAHWRLVSPTRLRADDDTVDDLLSDLSFLRADGFVDDPSDADTASFKQPAFEVILTPAGEGDAATTPLRLAVGGLHDGKRLVRAAQPSLYTIPADRLDNFPRELVAYRYKQLARFTITDANRLELHFQPATGDAVVITASRGPTGWQSTPEPMPEEKITQLVSELSRLRAKGILADSAGKAELRGLGLSPPTAILRVFGAAPKADAPAPQLAEVHLGNFRGPDGIVAQVAGDPVIYRLDAALAEQIPVSLEAFRSKFAGEASQASESDSSESDEPHDFLTPTEESP